MKVSFKAKEQKSFEPLEEGDYKVLLSTAAEGKSSKGNPGAKMEFLVDGTSRKIPEFIPFLESCEWKWQQFASAFQGEVEEGEDVEFDVTDFIGTTCWVHLGIRKYNNDKGEEKAVNEIAYYIPAGSAPSASKPTAKKSHAAPAAKAKEEEEDEENDDVPY
jgi:hypothetical protein